MDSRGSERVAIIAGASGAIGSATVRALINQKVNVVLAALPDPALDVLAHKAQEQGVRALIVPTDITRRDQIDVLVAKTLVEFGRIDILINAAGIGSSPSICDSSDNDLERVLAVNLLGPARLMHAVLPVMKAQGRGSIVNIGSLAGEAGIMGIYSGSKFGLRGLTDSVRREVRSCGIDVTLIQPGFVRSPMNPAHGNNLPGPEIVADAIVAALRRPKRKRIVPAFYRIPAFIVGAFPALADAVFCDARIQERINRDARAERGSTRS
ncbi:MAG TPA: SDR family NAD(P)-dependent oxidoreductase [Candidatus Baltobacteraceae bacterium]|jgi:NAD(P)-dependent dehydrogenase (short-subunit alcohol dehydrogenase family)